MSLELHYLYIENFLEKSTIRKKPTAQERQRAAGLPLVTLAVTVGGMVFGWRSIQACFWISALWVLALLTAREYLVRRETFGASLVSNALAFATALTSVTGFLYGASAWMAHFPPQHIVEWGERLEWLKRALDLAAEISSALLILLIVIYVGLVWKRRKTDKLAAVWKPSGQVHNWMQRAALVLTIIASFSFTAAHANNPSGAGGPMQVLNDERARALEQYQDLVWRINLSLSTEFKIQAAEALFQQLPTPEQATLARTWKLEAEAAKVSSAYDDPHFHGMKAEQILCSAAFPKRADLVRLDWECAQQHLLRARQWDSAENNAGAGAETMASPSPPPGTTLKQLQKADASVQEATKATPAPYWANSLGLDVVSQFLSQSLTSDHAPFLKAIAARMPLVGEAMNIVFDSVSDWASPRIQDEAVRLAEQQLKDPSIPLRARIHDIVAEFVPKIRRPDPVRPKKAEDRAALREASLQDRINRFHNDLKSAIAEQAQKSDEVLSSMEQMGLSRSDKPDSKESQEGPLEALVHQKQRAWSYEGTIIAALADHKVTEKVAQDALGKSYSWYKSHAEKLIEIRAEARRAQAEEEERAKEREVMER